MSHSRLLHSVLVPALKGHAGLEAQTFAAAYAYLASYVAATPLLIWVLDAPHGRFALQKSWLNLNANVGWLLMEIVSPITFYLSLTANRSFTSLTLPTRLLAISFVVHYFNRSIIFVARQKSKRSPMHLIVPIAATTFNLANGHQMGVWLSGITSSASRAGAIPESTLTEPLFVFGFSMWLIGFIGNIAHDEVLRNLRGPGKPAYSIPHGLLYDWPFGGISYPNYLCEWAEWAGFAIAATFASGFRCPPPLFGMGVVATSWLEQLLCPPWLFLWIELATMLPRALNGHKWYIDKFGRDMPKSRRALIPGIL